MTPDELRNNLVCLSAQDVSYNAFSDWVLLWHLCREHWQNRVRPSSCKRRRTARIQAAAVTSSAHSVSVSTAGSLPHHTNSSLAYRLTNTHLYLSFLISPLFSFLVADKVLVASVPPPSPSNPSPEQYVFASSADENEFAVYPDPRGKTLDRGTEITLVLKEDATEYLENLALIQLVYVSFLLVLFACWS